jgi:integrase
MKKRHYKKMTQLRRDEFYKLLNIMTPENGIKQSPSKKSNFFRPWLKNAYWLALLTGARRSELANFKWSDIHEEENVKAFWIYCAKERRIVGFIITAEVQKILDDLGFDEFQGTNNYVLAPEANFSRRSVIDLLSSSFTHFYKQLETGKNITFIALRKAFIVQFYHREGPTRFF